MLRTRNAPEFEVSRYAVIAQSSFQLLAFSNSESLSAAEVKETQFDPSRSVGQIGIGQCQYQSIGIGLIPIRILIPIPISIDPDWYLPIDSERLVFTNTNRSN